MNRLEMQEIIKERVPYLIEQRQNEWKEYEKQRQEFVRDYPIERIMKLTLDEYVIGKGSDNRSFCYRIERELDQLGRILGATANKFGLYYGKTNSDSTLKYRFATRWGFRIEDVFSNVKNEIYELLKNKDDIDTLKKNKLSPMFKGKILFLYHPNKFLSVYSHNHLSHFVAHLNMVTHTENELDLQKALMDYRASWSELLNESPFLFGALLYDQFGHPPKKTSQQIPLLSTAVAGASVCDTPTAAPPSRQNPDYEELQRNRKIIGDRGEKLVFELERNRLKDAGRNDLADKVLHIADTDDSKGFDILSFDPDGKERQIEVKSTSMDSFYKGFFLSANELEKSKSLNNYYLYLVSSTMSDKPVINPIPKPAYSEPEEFTLSPVLYNVRLNNMEAEQ